MTRLTWRFRRTRRFGLVAMISTLAAWSSSARASEPSHEIAVVVGAPGEAEYAAGFTAAQAAWRRAAAAAGANLTTIGLDKETNGDGDREQLREWLQTQTPDLSVPLWLVYLGHGTFDGREARLNLRGPDVTASELAEWLAPLRRPVIVVHGGSGSAPFLPALAGPNRIVITATRSGYETNYARFGEQFAAAVGNPAADIDQDGQVSLLEAFVTAAQAVQAFYEENGRLATELALIDDNGDGHGTPADWFRGTRLERKPEAGRGTDGDRARLVMLLAAPEERQWTAAERAQRDAGESALAALRARKGALPEEQYLRELEAILRELGALYRRDRSELGAGDAADS